MFKYEDIVDERLLNVSMFSFIMFGFVVKYNVKTIKVHGVFIGHSTTQCCIRTLMWYSFLWFIRPKVMVWDKLRSLTV